MKKSIGWILFLCILFVASIGPAEALFISTSGGRAVEEGEQAVVFYDEGIETIVLSAKYSGDGSEFAWIIPVPAMPQVEKGNSLLFSTFDAFTSASKDNSSVENGAAMKIAPPGEPLPAQDVFLDANTFETVSLKNMQALPDWLEKYGFLHDTLQVAKWMMSYAQSGWMAVAVRVSPQTWPSMQGQALYGSIEPIVIRFPTDTIVYPIKLFSVLPPWTPPLFPVPSSFPVVPTTAPVPPSGEAAETEWRGYGSHLYKRIWVGTSTWNEARSVCLSRGADLASITTKDEDEFARSVCGIGHYCNIGHTNPGGYCEKPYGNWLDGQPWSYENWSPGEPGSYTCKEDCLDINVDGKWNNVWCDRNIGYAKFAICEKADSNSRVLGLETQSKVGIPNEMPFLPPADPRPYPSPTVNERLLPLTLYLFADHKKELPKFTTDYAGWVIPADFTKKLSPSPWGQINRKMYLTKLSRHIPVANITQDLYPQDAPDNTEVNVKHWWDNRWVRVGVVMAGVVFIEIIIIGSILYLQHLRRKNG